VVEFYKANLRNEKNILPEVVFFYVIWYKMKWSFDYKINQLSLHGSQTVSRDAQSLGKCLQCYALYHFHLRKFLIRYSIFLTTPFAGSHLNWSIKTSGDSLVACKNQNLTSWPTGNISETLETWTVKGRDVKLTDSPSCENFKSQPANVWIWWQGVGVWLIIWNRSHQNLSFKRCQKLI